MPGLLVAYAPVGACTVDRCLVSPPFVVGRGPDCHLAIRDTKVSKNHFRITHGAEGFVLEDLESTNGTFLNGRPIIGKCPVRSQSVIRVGSAVLVFVQEASILLEPPPIERYEMAGVFHTGPLLDELGDAASSARHVLLAGPTGTGKELAARAITAMTTSRTGKPLKLLAHNAARFSSAEEAAATLFGVGARVFSGVDERAGLIARAHGGALFIDEVHNLPARVQRSLLRVIEDGQTARIGETAAIPAEVRFIFASNAPGKTRGLAGDLFARLRLVQIPPLTERIADIPRIFEAVLTKTFESYGLNVDQVSPLLEADHFEALCLDGFAAENIRGLVDLADRIATRITRGTTPLRTIEAVFGGKYGDGPVSKRGAPNKTKGPRHYEDNRDLIIAAYRECNGNLSAAERLLKSRGLSCSRRWLAKYLDKWEVRDQ
ncbi:MAG: FHA domain-containing protein [Deltaproteobacteria bacterium]|nr:FHA domain-containing protein [Deltaproteobacteria bacterium]